MSATAARDDFMRSLSDDLQTVPRMEAIESFRREEIDVLVPVPLQRWRRIPQANKILMRNLDVEQRLRPHDGDEFGKDRAWIRDVFEHLAQNDQVIVFLQNLAPFDARGARDRRLVGNVIDVMQRGAPTKRRIDPGVAAPVQNPRLRRNEWSRNFSTRGI